MAIFAYDVELQTQIPFGNDKQRARMTRKSEIGSTPTAALL
jgi:hypothetical protein